MLDEQNFGNAFALDQYPVRIEADITNLSDKRYDIQVSHYYDAGNLFIFSPGASASTYIHTVEPDYRGVIEIPMEILRPMRGATLQVEVFTTVERNAHSGLEEPAYRDAFELEYTKE